MCADIAGEEVELIVKSMEEMNVTDKEFKAKKGHLKCPLLELEDGSFMGQTMAVCKYFLAKGGEGSKALLGTNAFEAAKIDQWGLTINGYDKHWACIITTCFGHT